MRSRPFHQHPTNNPGLYVGPLNRLKQQETDFTCFFPSPLRPGIIHALYIILKY